MTSLRSDCKFGAKARSTESMRHFAMQKTQNQPAREATNASATNKRRIMGAQSESEFTKPRVMSGF